MAINTKAEKTPYIPSSLVLPHKNMWEHYAY